jgi:hypothetical protein
MRWLIDGSSFEESFLRVASACARLAYLAEVYLEIQELIQRAVLRIRIQYLRFPQALILPSLEEVD